MSVLSLSASELVAQFRELRISPVEAAEAVLARIAQADGPINAFRFVDEESVLEAARQSEARWREQAPAGALDGVPVAVKDVFLTRGWPTLRGSRTVDPAGPWQDDAPAVAALRRHGAVLAGKTTTPELGWKAVTDSPLDGVTRNPWDVSRTAGGSSGGSAAALAAGMVPLALGTDGGGSIRIPAGFCGVAGIKPTWGRVPAWPASPFGILAHSGPMARTVTDLALALDVLCEPDRRDWQALPPTADSFLRGLDDGVRGLRIALHPDLGHVSVDPEVAAAVAKAAEAFGELGAHVEQLDAAFEDLGEVFDVLWAAGAAGAASAFDDAALRALDPGLAVLIATGRAQTLASYLEALRRRDAFGRQMSVLHERWDLLLTPTLPLAAFAAGRNVPDGWPDERWRTWTPFTHPFNLTQQPAASVPCGLTSGGLPIGLQIVGPRYGDALVLRAARAYEAAHPQPTTPPLT